MSSHSSLIRPELSIITVVLNGEDFIHSCLNIVISQKCSCLEHLVIDGGSTDKTIKIVQEFLPKNPHIRLLVIPGLSQSAAMNTGITLAQGKIIGFLNDDDYYEPDVLNHILELFHHLPEPAFLVGNCNIRADKEEIVGLNKPKRLKILDLLAGNYFNPHPINPSAYFYHKSLHKVIGLYRTDDEYAMDLDFILKAVQFAHVKYIDEIWGNFRFIAGTKTFHDFHTGEAAKREMRVFEPFFQLLSPQKRIYVIFLRIILHFQLHLKEGVKRIFFKFRIKRRLFLC